MTEVQPVPPTVHRERFNSFIRIAIAIVVLTLIIGLSGCTRANSLKLGDPALPQGNVPSGSTFVEAFLEYVGPPDRWAGPKTVVIHLTARDPQIASVLITPNPVTPQTEAGGNPPSAAGQLSQLVARGELEDLSRSVLDQAVPFAGCLYPIRIKLIRADGSLLQREGCRGDKGWPVALSRVVSNMIEVARVEQRGKPPTARLAIGSSARVE